jgi:hypothetical protein
VADERVKTKVRTTYLRSLANDPTAFRTNSPVAWRSHVAALCDECDSLAAEVERLRRERDEAHTEVAYWIAENDHLRETST